MAFYANQQLLYEGAVMLYQRQSPAGLIHPVWQMRLKLRGRTGYITRSCKTKNYEEACAVAEDEFLELKQKVRHGIPLKDWSFNQHWRDWYFRQVGKGAWSESRKRWHQNYFDRYFTAYFGDKSLGEITTPFADAYWGWRIGFWKSAEGEKLQRYNPKRRGSKTKTTSNAKKHPSNKTLRMEQSALNQIFHDAAQQQRTQALIRLKAPRPNRLDTRRPAFDDDEWAVLTKHLHDWAEGINAYTSDRANAYHKKQRQQLRAYVLFLANSGLRVGEARKMRWADIGVFKDKAPDKEYLQIRVRADTKKGTSRTVIPMPDARICLSDWLLLSGNPDQQDTVWHGGDLNKTFEALLRRIPYQDREENLLCDADGARRPLYSLRHTYATMALLHGDLTEFELARNMGTTVAQIERHYSHVRNQQKAAKLSGMRLPSPDPEKIPIRDAIDREMMNLIDEQLEEDFGHIPDET